LVTIREQDVSLKQELSVGRVGESRVLAEEDNLELGDCRLAGQPEEGREMTAASTPCCSAQMPALVAHSWRVVPQ